MARPTTLKFGKFFVRLSDGGDPPEFVAPCGFSSKSFTRSKSLNETPVGDCDDPDKPAWSERDVVSMSATISGQGVLAKEAVDIWEAALADEDSIECEVELVYGASDSRLYEGRFHLESFEITGSSGDRVQVSVTMQSDGPIVYTKTP